MRPAGPPSPRLILTALAAAAPCLAAAPARPPAVEAVRAAGSIRIDGRIDEAAWDSALVIDDFVQQLPREGVPPTERTEVRLLYDEEALYLAFRCFDSDPAAIQVGSLLRDDFAQTAGESLAFSVDSNDSGRDGFWFSSNPGGAQIDAQIFNEGQIFDRDWDGIWESAGAIDGAGWTLEVRLPFFNLRFREGPENVMRINFFRAIRHKNEEIYSPFIPRNYQGTFSFSLGRPVILRGVRRGRRIDLKPYGLVSASSEFLEEDDSDVLGEAGVDLKWRITPNFTGDFTVNPDFAQVEADNVQINLTRFPLFFPEKREFFLENAGLFSFGLAGQTQAFFSRRIGLDAGGRTVPLLGGARLTGRSGPWSIGALEVVADETAEEPRTNFAVGRLKRDVGARSTIGAILTDREAQGPGGGNRLAGADGRLVFGEDLFWESYAMASREDGGGNEWAARTELRKGGDRWRWSVSGSLVDEAFQPGVGFIRRPGIQRADGNVEFRPRPASIAAVRQFSFSAAGTYLESRTDDDGMSSDVRDRIWTLGHNTEFESGDRAGAFLEERFERLTGEFEIVEGVVIPPGDYDNDIAEINFSTWNARRYSGGGFVNHGGFFEGRRTVYGAVFTARFNRHLTLESSYNHNRVRLPFGDFDTNLWINRLKFAFTPNLFGSALIQWNDLTDDIDLNLRLDFIHMPGADLFLVYNESYNTDRGPDEPTSNRRAGIVKLTWLFHF